MFYVNNSAFVKLARNASANFFFYFSLPVTVPPIILMNSVP